MDAVVKRLKEAAEILDLIRATGEEVAETAARLSTGNTAHGRAAISGHGRSIASLAARERGRILALLDTQAAEEAGPHIDSNATSHLAHQADEADVTGCAALPITPTALAEVDLNHWVEMEEVLAKHVDPRIRQRHRARAELLRRLRQACPEETEDAWPTKLNG
jgi:hypothetical protein